MCDFEEGSTVTVYTASFLGFWSAIQSFCHVLKGPCSIEGFLGSPPCDVQSDHGL